VERALSLGRSALISGLARLNVYGPFTPDAVNRLIKRVGERAGFAFLSHTQACLRLRPGECGA
jgi:hypothetical protein